MHGPIRDRLEELLPADSRARNFRLARKSGPVGAEITDHLAKCTECSSEVEAMRLQSAHLAVLSSSESAEPAAGFYARVLQRIEEQEIDSFWSFFSDSPFGRRLALASLTIAVALGSYVVSLERSERPAEARSMFALSAGVHYDPLVMGSPAEQRDAVLENFTENHLTSGQGQIR